jgi:hypothetical protein
MFSARETHSNPSAREVNNTSDDLQSGQRFINESEAHENVVYKCLSLYKAEKAFERYLEDKNSVLHRTAKLKLLEVYVRMTATVPEESDLVVDKMKSVLDQLPLDNSSDQLVTLSNPKVIFETSMLSCYHAHYHFLLGLISQRRNELSHAVSAYQESLRYFQLGNALLTRFVDSSKAPVTPGVSEMIDGGNSAIAEVKRLISSAEQTLSSQKTDELPSPTGTGLGLFADKNTIPADRTDAEINLTSGASSPRL